MRRDTTVIAFRQPEAIDDPLSEVAPSPCLCGSSYWRANNTSFVRR